MVAYQRASPISRQHGRRGFSPLQHSRAWWGQRNRKYLSRHALRAFGHEHPALSATDSKCTIARMIPWVLRLSKRLQDDLQAGVATGKRFYLAIIPPHRQRAGDPLFRRLELGNRLDSVWRRAGMYGGGSLVTNTTGEPKMSGPEYADILGLFANP